LPVEQIVRLLAQRFRLLTSGDRELPRHQTLRAMIDWSYELLDDAEKALFARLAGFASGWTLAAAEVVCGGDPITKDEVVYVLIGLIEQSLVVADEDGDRYRMLETVREYAKEKLLASGGTDSVRQRHCDYYLALSEEADQKLKGSEQSAWLQRLDKEYDNIRSALEWCLMKTESRAGLLLCGSLDQFWWMRGHLSEGREWCTRLLGQPGAEERTPARAKALNAAGTLAIFQADYPAALALNKESLAIWRKLDDRRGVALSLNKLGTVALDQGEYLAAQALYEESLNLRRELEDRHGMATTLNALGSVASYQGNLTSARELLEESLQISEELGDRLGVARSFGNLGLVDSAQGDYPAAKARYERTLAIARELKNQEFVAGSLFALGLLCLETSDFAAAVSLHRESLAIWHELGTGRGTIDSLTRLAEGIAALGSPLRAARIWGAEYRLRAEHGLPLAPMDRSDHDRHVAIARAALGNDVAFDRAWQEGRALTLDQAIELALEKSAEQP